MKKILFACDLDNTILYSYKRRQPGDICIEMLKEKEQGFVSEKSLKLLEEVQKKCIFLPITTRSIEQYERINWSPECKPQQAITTNGSILLSNGEKDSDWYSESQSIYSSYHDELLGMYNLLKDDQRFIRCRLVDDFYLFTYCRDDVDARELELELSQKCKLNVTLSGKKLYFFPPEFNKGDALKRFVKLISPDIIISAGDTVIDIPMLSLADYALVPNNALAYQCQNGSAEVKVCPIVERFSDFVLSTALDIIEKA